MDCQYDNGYPLEVLRRMHTLPFFFENFADLYKVLYIHKSKIMSNFNNFVVFFNLSGNCVCPKSDQTIITNTKSDCLCYEKALSRQLHNIPEEVECFLNSESGELKTEHIKIFYVYFKNDVGYNI